MQNASEYEFSESDHEPLPLLSSDGESAFEQEIKGFRNKRPLWAGSKSKITVAERFRMQSRFRYNNLCSDEESDGGNNLVRNGKGDFFSDDSLDRTLVDEKEVKVACEKLLFLEKTNGNFKKSVAERIASSPSELSNNSAISGTPTGLKRVPVKERSSLIKPPTQFTPVKPSVITPTELHESHEVKQPPRPPTPFKPAAKNAQQPQPRLNKNFELRLKANLQPKKKPTLPPVRLARKAPERKEPVYPASYRTIYNQLYRDTHCGENGQSSGRRYETNSMVVEYSDSEQSDAGEYATVEVDKAQFYDPTCGCYVQTESRMSDQETQDFEEAEKSVENGSEPKFTPYGLSDFRRMNIAQKLGGLGNPKFLGWEEKMKQRQKNDAVR